MLEMLLHLTLFLPCLNHQAFDLDFITPIAQVVAQDASGPVGTQVELLASVSDSATGMPIPGYEVEFSIDGTVQGTVLTDANGVGRQPFFVFFAPPVSRTISATTPDTAEYLGSSDTAVLSEVKSLPLLTSYSPPATYFGGTYDLSAWLRDTRTHDVEGGPVRFWVNDQDLGADQTDIFGMAYLQWSCLLEPGLHQLTTGFNGDLARLPVTSTRTFRVYKAKTKLEMSYLFGNRGATVPLTATLINEASEAPISGENVAFSVSGAAIGTAVTDSIGVAAVPYTVPSSGQTSWTVQASFEGGQRYEACNVTGSLSVGSSLRVDFGNTTLTRPNEIPSYRFTLYVTYPDATQEVPAASTTVRFIGAALDESVVTDSLGVGVVHWNSSQFPLEGTYPIQITSQPSTYWRPLNAHETLTVIRTRPTLTAINTSSDTHLMVGRTLSIQCRLTAGATNVRSKPLDCYLNNELWSTKLTSDAGVANFSGPVSPGPDGPLIASVRFAGDTDFLPANPAVLAFERRNFHRHRATLYLHQFSGDTHGTPYVAKYYFTNGALAGQFEGYSIGSGNTQAHVDLIGFSEQSYRFVIKPSHWLAKAGNLNLTNWYFWIIGSSVSFHNGDCDEDNEVGPGDFGVISNAFGAVEGDSNWIPNADLDGDGEVGPSDFGILSANFGMVGDE